MTAATDANRRYQMSSKIGCPNYMPTKTNKIGRREFLAAIGGSLALLSLDKDASSQTSPALRNDEFMLYVGTYTSGSGKGQGIYSFHFSEKGGELTPAKAASGVADPSFVVVDKSRKFLFSVNETLEYEGKKSGSVSSFTIDRKSGDLTFLNKQPSLGGAPCHLTVSANNRFLLAANYVGGNVAVFPIGKDGKLGPSVDVKQHTGAGPNKDRQLSAHAHSINLDRNDRFAVACDLGADTLFIYKFDSETGELSPNPDQPSLKTKPGAGPRHFAFHPNGRTAFVINELSSSLTVLAYDEKRGMLAETQTISSLPANWNGANTCADIHISPNGRFVYGSNRGHDSIVSYKFDERLAKLELIEHVSTQGKTPRNFAVDPSGKYLLAANQNTDTVVTFRIEEGTGKLMPTGAIVSVPSPVCLRFV